MAALLTSEGYKFQTQFRFDKKRKWRFDFVLEPLCIKIAIEVNGFIFGRGKHSWGTQLEKDYEKLNAAAMDEWIVLQYSPNTLPDVIRDLDMMAKLTNTK